MPRLATKGRKLGKSTERSQRKRQVKRSSCEEGPGQSALQSAYHDPHLDVTELKQNRTTWSVRPKIPLAALLHRLTLLPTECRA